MLKAQTARAPGKLILSGEHAVLQGGPILVSAVDRYAWTSVGQRAQGLSDVFFSMRDLSYAKTLPWNALQSLKKRLKSHYKDFLAGNRSIREVLEKPFELLQYVVSELGGLLKFSPLGLEVTTGSSIPPGCGLGSSSAVIVSTLFAIVQYFKVSFPMEELIRLSQQMENLQHGRSSGVDVRVSSYGGVFWGPLSDLNRLNPECFSELTFDVLFTGPSDSTTGECVAVTQPLLSSNAALLSDFRDCAHGIHQATLMSDAMLLRDAIRQNHRLLVEIQVVPARVQEMVKHVEEAFNGAAKLCGAGSIRGSAAGALWVYVPPEYRVLLQEWAGDFPIPLWSLRSVQQGAQLFNEPPGL